METAQASSLENAGVFESVTDTIGMSCSQLLQDGSTIAWGNARQ